MRICRARHLCLTLCIVFPVAITCMKDPASPEEQRDELKPRGSISGSVAAESGDPLAGVIVSTDRAGYTTVTDSSGRFVLSDVLDGTYTLHFTRYGYCDKSLEEIEVKIDADVVLAGDVEMRTAFCVIEGTVVAGLAKGAASGVRGAGVAIPGQPVATIVDENGEFRLTGVSPDADRLVAALGAVGWGEKEVSLEAGDVLSGVTVTLELSGGTITGRVLDESGEPAADVRVETMGGGIADTSDSSGRYKLTNVPAGVPITITAGETRLVSGLVVEEEATLDGIDLQPESRVETAAITLRDGAYIVADSVQRFRISAAIVYDTTRNPDIISAVLWDVDDDGAYDTATSVPSLEVNVAPEGCTVGYGVIAASGDTVGMAYITIRRAAAKPEIRLDSSITVAPGEEAVLRGNVVCQSGGIKMYYWDFEGDGDDDWMRPDHGTVTTTYKEEGTYAARFRIETQSGWRDSATLLVVVEGSEQQPPADRLHTPEITSLADTMRTAFDIVWNAGKADSYAVAVDTVSPPKALVAEGQTDTLYRLEGLTPGKIYYCQVYAYGGGDTVSSPSVAVHVVANEPPVFADTLFAPVSPHTHGGDGGVALSWSASDPENDELVYTVYFGTADSLDPFDEGIADTALTVTPPEGWEDGVTYYWEVEASDGWDVVRSPRMEISYSVPSNSPPVIDSAALHPGEGGAVGGDSVTLVWSASDPDGDTLVYDVYFGTTSPPGLLRQGVSDTAVVVAPEGGWSETETYRWQVYASDGTDRCSTSVRAFTWAPLEQNTPPVFDVSAFEPADGAGLASDTIVLRWSASDDDGDTLLYDLYFGVESSPGLHESAVVETTVTIVGERGRDYHWQVAAFDGEDTVFSDTLSLSVPAAGQVAAPTFTPDGGEHTNSVTVTLSCATGGAEIRYTLDGATPTAGSPLYGAPLIISSTTTVKAVAYKGGMTESAVASATFTVQQVAEPVITTHPQDASVAAGDTATFIIIAQGDSLQYQWLRNDTAVTGEDAAEYSFVAGSEDNGAAFRCVVSNSGGEKRSNAAILTVTQPADTSAPSAPDTVVATPVSDSRIDLQWSVADDPESGIARYVVYRDGAKAGETTATSYADTGLAASTTYQYRISAVNGEEIEGAQSAAQSATTLASVSDTVAIVEPPAGTTLRMGSTVTLVGEGTSLEWSYDADADGKAVVGVGSGNNVSFRVPTDVTSPQTLTLILTADAGVDSMTYQLSDGSGSATAPSITAHPADTAVVAGDTAVFRVSADGDSLQYQWLSYRVFGHNDWPQPTGIYPEAGGSGAVYAFVADSTHDGVEFFCAVSNGGGSDTSSRAMLTVSPAAAADNTPPSFDSASARGNATKVLLSFSEPLEGISAQNVSNYSIAFDSAMVSLATAELQSDSMHVLLTTKTSLDSGAAYTVSVSGIRDIAGNRMTTGSSRAFTYVPGVHLLYPNGGETFTIGENVTITWTAGADVSDAVVEITLDAGLSWQALTEGSSIQKADPEWGAFLWTVPAELGGSSTVSDQCMVRVHPYLGLNPSDMSDRVFSIVAQ